MCTKKMPVAVADALPPELLTRITKSGMTLLVAYLELALSYDLPAELQAATQSAWVHVQAERSMGLCEVLSDDELNASLSR